MKATCIRLGALLLAGLAVSAAAADPAWSPVLKTPLGQAPDACGPGFYWRCPDGTTYGPNYYLVPPWAAMCPLPPGPAMGRPGGLPPFPGGRVGPAVGPPASFMTHPFARSPRDYFMD